MEPEVSALPGWQYGVLGIAAFLFAGVIVFLFKFYNRRIDLLTAERESWLKKEASWDAELAKLRLEYEEKHRALVETTTKEMREERDNNRDHEDAARKEFAEMMEAVSEASTKSSQALVDVLGKFYDRFVGPTRGHRY